MGFPQAEEKRTLLLPFTCNGNSDDLIHSRNKLPVSPLSLFHLTQGKIGEWATCLFHSMNMQGLSTFQIPPAISTLNPTGKSKMSLFSKVLRWKTYNQMLVDE